MQSSLKTRVDRLEALAPTHDGALIVVGPYSSSADPAPFVAEALSHYRTRYGVDAPDNARLFHIQLVGVQPLPEGASRAH